jgi:predicted nucleic acid-binding protein
VVYLLQGGQMAARCAPHIEGQVIALSFQSLGELWYGALKRPLSHPTNQALDNLVRRLVVLGFDEATVRAWAELRRDAERQGLTKQVADLWIAATAKRHDLPLLTNDSGLFRGLSISVIPLGNGSPRR